MQASLVLRASFLLALLALPACTDPTESETEPAVTDSPYNTSLDMKNLMSLVVEPVADTLWESAGWVLSDAGYEELYPTTNEGWDFAYRQSAMIIEIGSVARQGFGASICPDSPPRMNITAAKGITRPRPPSSGSCRAVPTPSRRAACSMA